MKENMLDVLLYLFEHCVDDELAIHPDEETIRNQLSAAGFEETDIKKAFHWLESLAQPQEGSESPAPEHAGKAGGVGGESAAPPALRIYTREEMDKIGPRSRALILFLEQMDILKPATRELVIDRIMALETEDMDLEGVRWVILMVLFNQPGLEAGYGLLEDFVLDETRIRDHLH